MKEFINRQISRVGAAGLFLTINPWVKSLDIKIAHYDKSVNPARTEYFEPCIFVFWHEYIVLPTMVWGNSNVTLLVSQHRDADWLVNIGKHMGFDAIRGSTTRGGPSAIRACREVMKTNSLAMTPDGPKGPRRQMALGAIFLASRLQCPIIPIGFGYQNPIRLKTWDHFAVPKPGSRVRAIMGPKIRIPRKADRDQLEAYRLAITENITTLTTICEHAAATGVDIDAQVPFIKNWNIIRNSDFLRFSEPINFETLPDLRMKSTEKRMAA